MTQDLIKIIYISGFKNSINTIFNSVFNTTSLVEAMETNNEEILKYTIQGELPNDTKITIENGGEYFQVKDIIQLKSTDNSKDGVLRVVEISNNNGEILNVTIENQGLNYNVNDIIFGVTNGNGSSASFQVDNVDTNDGGILNVSIISNGHYYSINDIIEIVPKIGTGGTYYVNSVDENGSVTSLKRKYGGLLYNSGTLSQTSETIETNNFGTGLILSIDADNIIYSSSVTLFTLTFEMKKLNTENISLLRNINSSGTLDEYRTFVNNLNIIAINWRTIIKRGIDNLSLVVANTRQEDGYNKMQTTTSSTSLSKIMLNVASEEYMKIYMTKLQSLNDYASNISNFSDMFFQKMSWQQNSPITMFLFNEFTSYINAIRDVTDSIISFCEEFKYIVVLHRQGIYNVELNSINFQSARENVLSNCDLFVEATANLLTILEKQ